MAHIELRLKIENRFYNREQSRKHNAKFLILFDFLLWHKLVVARTMHIGGESGRIRSYRYTTSNRSEIIRIRRNWRKEWGKQVGEKMELVHFQRNNRDRGDSLPVAMILQLVN